MSEIERIIEAMTAPPAPAAEVVILDRVMAERALTWMESHPEIASGSPSLSEEECVFRQALAEPKFELWAIHSVGLVTCPHASAGQTLNIAQKSCANWAKR